MTTIRRRMPDLFDDDAAAWAWQELTDMTTQLRDAAGRDGMDVEQLMKAPSIGMLFRSIWEHGQSGSAARAGLIVPYPVDGDAVLADCEPFKRYFTAVGYLASHDTMRFVDGGKPLVAPAPAWGEFIRQPWFSTRGFILCLTTVGILTGKRPPPDQGAESYLHRFTKDVLGLDPERYADPVVRTLWDSPWHDAKVSSPLAYVYGTVRKRVKLDTDHRILRPDSADIMSQAEGRPRVDSLDAPRMQEPVSDPFSAMIPDPCTVDEFDDALNRLAIRNLVEHADLPAGAEAYLRAKYDDGVSRDQAVDVLGRTRSEISAIDKGVQRRRPQWRENLSG